MTRIIADNHIPFLKGVLEPFAKMRYAKNGKIDHAMAMKADGLIIRTRTRCDAALLEGTPVKFIATATIGYDHIDTNYCAEKGISWQHAPGCNASSVMQYIASVLVTLAANYRFSLSGKRIGIIGVGHVGSKVAQLAKALGMVPLLNDPPRAIKEGPQGFISLEEISENADIITLHVPLSYKGKDKTFHLADENFFQGLRKKPLLINTSRGPVVDTNAVKAAIRNGNISGFAADVWENEPDLDPGLLKMTHIATPHIAGYSVEGKANGTAACVRAVSRFFGFGIDDWYPSQLPSQLKPLIEIDATGLTEEQLMAEAITATYNVRNDDLILRNDISQFEKHRNHYPVRREFEAFTVECKNSSPGLNQQLVTLGFKMGVLSVKCRKFAW